MLQQSSLQVEDMADYRDSLNEWIQLYPKSFQQANPSLQKQWDSIVVTSLVSSLEFERDEDKTRLLAIRKPELGAWLHALPAKSIGTLLDNNGFRIIIRTI